MRMGKRLALGFGLILTLLIFVGFLGYWSVKSISGATVGMIHGDAHIAENAAEARAHIVGLRRYEKDLYLNIGSPEKEADYLKKWASEHEELINEHIPQLEKTAALDKDREKIANMKQELASYETGFNQVYADMQAGKIKTPQEANAAINAYKESMHKMEQAAKELAEAGNKRMDLMEPALKSLTGRTLLMMAILIILAMVMSTAIGIVITRSIAGPVREITVSAKNISIGEIEQDVGIMRNDEIGSLADSFRAMVAYLRMISVTAEQIAAGDLTAEVAPKSEKDILGNAFKVMLDGLREIVTEIKNGADQIASAAVQIAATSEQTVKNNETSATAVEETTSTMHEMSANIQNISRSARSQASSVAQTSASIEQLAASTQKIATTAQQLVDLSRNAKKAVALGIESVTQSIQGTEDISKTIIRSADTISALGSRAEDIGKIVEVIDDIAEQTNLLALNAAIEAARAGEQGLGFAVVAEEVRKLAERSAKSTREIAELISGIQKEAIEAVKLMDKSTQIVERGVEMSTQAGSSLREIEGNVLEVDKFAREIGDATHEQGGGSTQIAAASENLSEITHEVTSATDEQATAAEQIVNTMEKMRSVIQQNASASAELASSAEQLRANADTFRKLVGRFELTASQTAGGATGKRKGKNGGNGSRSEYLATGTV